MRQKKNEYSFFFLFLTLLHATRYSNALAYGGDVVKRIHPRRVSHGGGRVRIGCVLRKVQAVIAVFGPTGVENDRPLNGGTTKYISNAVFGTAFVLSYLI